PTEILDRFPSGDQSAQHSHHRSGHSPRPIPAEHGRFAERHTIATDAVGRNRADASFHPLLPGERIHDLHWFGGHADRDGSAAAHDVQPEAAACRGTYRFDELLEGSDVATIHARDAVSLLKPRTRCRHVGKDGIDDGWAIWDSVPRKSS